MGNTSDIPLLKKAKYGINFDVGCMIDDEWIDSLENGYVERSRDEIIRDIVNYYKDFKASESEDER